jgi:hypothetical protein
MNKICKYINTQLCGCLEECSEGCEDLTEYRAKDNGIKIPNKNPTTLREAIALARNPQIPERPVKITFNPYKIEF